MKKFIGVILLMLFALSVVGCSNGTSSDEASGDNLTFFINPKSIGPAYWSAAEKGAKSAGDDLGIEVIFNAPSTTDSSEQINMIQDMLTRQVNGIAVAPNDPEAINNIFNTAIGNGVHTVTWDSDAPNTAREYYLAPATDEQLGIEFAEIIAEQIGGEGKIAFMVASLSAQNQTAKFEAAEEFLASEYPGIEIVNTVSSNDDQQTAYENAQNLISSYPDLKGLVGFAGAEAPAAAQAVEAAVNNGQIEEGQIAITGFAVPSLVESYVNNSTIEKLITWDPVQLGYATVYTLHLLAAGEAIEDNMEIPTIGNVKVDGQMIFIGTQVLTKDNVEDFDF